jgi:threonine synthase
MWDFADLLPVLDRSAAVSLGEGATPLVPSRGAAGGRLFYKLELQGPTGSQKDRALALALTRAREVGAPRIIMASTGSAGLAGAAYAARAGLPCLILVPRGTPEERLRPMEALGAAIAEVDGSFEQVEQMLASIAGQPGWYEATTTRAANPYQAEAPKTIAYEVVLALGGAPDWVVVPVGGGATLFGIWRGFMDLVQMGRIPRAPRMVGVQPARFNALEIALARGLRTQAELAGIGLDEHGSTVARNLKHAVPPDGADALRAIRESSGLAVSVTDDEALRGQQELGAGEGIFCEPSSAVVLVAIQRLRKDGVVQPGEQAVAVITGSGLRDVGALGAAAGRRRVSLPATAGRAELERCLA